MGRRDRRRIPIWERPWGRSYEIDWNSIQAQNLVFAAPLGTIATGYDRVSGSGLFNVSSPVTALPSYHPEVGQCMGFAGGTDYLAFDNSAQVRITGSMTISAWFRPTAASFTGYPRIASKLSSAPYNGYELLIGDPTDSNGHANKPYFQTGNAGTLKSVDGATVAQNDLVFCVVRYSSASGDAECWQSTNEGPFALQNTSNIGGSAIGDSSSTLLEIGRWPTNAAYFTGEIFDVRIYNEFLPDIVLQQMFFAGTRWELYRESGNRRHLVDPPPPTRAFAVRITLPPQPTMMF